MIGVEADAFKTRRRDARARALASYYLACGAGLTQREVAEYLRMGTGSAVSKQMQWLVNERGDNRVLAKLMEKIEDRLKNSRPSLLPVVKA